MAKMTRMKVNSGSALNTGRKVLASNNNSWGSVHDAGVRRASDGVIVVSGKNAASSQAAKKPKG
jgi:hypothetical protein